MNFLITILVLFVSTTLFCWLLTLNLGLGPVSNLVFFLSGILIIGLVAISTLKFFAHPE